jgi:hypothetical protein
MITETKTCAIIPAPPGWHVAYVVWNGKPNDGTLVETPLVAWEIERYEPADPRKSSWCVVMPVPFSSAADLNRYPWFVRDPAGIYHYGVEGHGTCPDAETAVRYAFECEGSDLGEERHRLHLITQNSRQ